MNQKGQNDLTRLVQGVFIVIIIIFAIFQVGSIFGLWNWVKPFFSGVWIILKWSFLLGIIAAIVWFVTWVVKREKEKKFAQEQVAKGLTLHDGKWLTKTQLEEAEKKKQEELEKERKKAEEIEKKKQEELEKERKKEERNRRNIQKIKQIEREDEEKKIRLELKIRYEDELKKLSPEEREIYLDLKCKEKITDNNHAQKFGSDKHHSHKSSLFNEVVNEINHFKPARKYRNEFSYQVELVGYLKSKFPNADIEQQRGSSRPDIVINHIAIEVKGPTKSQDLKTIPDKCMRYYQHFEEFIIVLFEVEVNNQFYYEWEKGIITGYPNVKIIRK